MKKSDAKALVLHHVHGFQELPGSPLKTVV